MKDYPSQVKEKLLSLIDEVSKMRSLFVKNPDKDFTRQRKLPFETIIKFLIEMGGNSIYKELLESQGYDANTATTSAFIQQRDKILPAAFEFLLHEFTLSHANIKKYKGYRLLAVDGSDMQIPKNPDDLDTYCHNQHEDKICNLIHLDALYDLYNGLYLDCIVTPNKLKNEYKAFVNMVDRSRINDKAIVIGDRGYESYNNLAHIEKKGWHYLIRIKDAKSTGILSGLNLPTDDEFDTTVHRILTRKQTNEIKDRPDAYKILTNKTTFDFLDLHTNKFYPMTFRVVRFKISDASYATVITSLTDCHADEIKALYQLRWGIETSFRELKYTVGLINFHAKKVEFIVQEIFARIIMYNFVEMIASYVVISHSDTHYIYQVNFTVAVHACRHFLRLCHALPPPDIESLIRKNTVPFRPERKAVRHLRNKSVVSFVYRVA